MMPTLLEPYKRLTGTEKMQRRGDLVAEHTICIGLNANLSESEVPLSQAEIKSEGRKVVNE